MNEEFYTRPILTVHDVSASIAYYCEKLGFTAMWSFPDDNPIIAEVGRSGINIILDSKSALPKSSTPSVLSMTLHQAEQLGALHEDVSSRGATITASPFEVVWEKNLFQFDVEDLDGNILIFWGDEPTEKLTQ